MNRPCLAAITLNPRGGGIAAVSRLLWQALRAEWPDDSRLVTLLDADTPQDSLESGLAARAGFGLRLAAAQVAGSADWLMFSHLGLADVQRFVPAFFRRPYAVFLHDVEAWAPLSSTRRRALAGATLRLANSRFTAQRVMAAHPDVGTVEPCALGLPSGFVPPSPGSAPLLGPNAVLVVGRMVASERYKGHDQLLDAWPHVVRRVPDATLVFAGGGDDTERLRTVATARGLSERVVVTGFVSDEELTTLYGCAAVFAMPSRREGFGLVYLEAMASGLPCIGSVHDAAGEIITDGETGFLVDQADTRALVDRIVGLLDDPGRRRLMGEAGRRRCLERFGADQFTRRVIGLVADAGLLGTPTRSQARRWAG